MAFALVPALLKAWFKVNEMVTTLMLNYAVGEVLIFLSEGVFRDPKAGYVATPMLRESAMFRKLGGNDLTAFTFWPGGGALRPVRDEASKLGFEIEAIGKNPAFAEAAGMRVRRKIVTAMLLSGALSGLAGAGWMMSERFRYSLAFSGPRDWAGTGCSYPCSAPTNRSGSWWPRSSTEP
jgi:simple sugar transport system permease protein